MLKRCEMCGRTPRSGTTEHHLIPRTCHSNKWFKKRFTRQQMQTTIDVCRDCHSAIHALLPDEKQLAREFPTLELLLAEPRIARHVEWARKQK